MFSYFWLQAVRARKSAEMQYEESSARVKDLSTININLSNAKSKLEQEIAIIAGDYDEVSKELRVSISRYNSMKKYENNFSTDT